MVLVLRARAVMGRPRFDQSSQEGAQWKQWIRQRAVDRLALSERQAGREDAMKVLFLCTARDRLDINALPPLCPQHHAFPVDGWLQRSQESLGVAEGRSS